jgi:hypothetical protein
MVGIRIFINEIIAATNKKPNPILSNQKAKLLTCLASFSISISGLGNILSTSKKSIADKIMERPEIR